MKHLLLPPPAGAVLYRIPLSWGHNKFPWKVAHAAVMLLAFVLSVVGLCAVFDFHNNNHIANMYSLHSWIGITATALFCTQVCKHFTHRNRITSQSVVSFLLDTAERWLLMILCSLCLWMPVQWVFGMIGFLLPCTQISIRKLLKPIHVWFGSMILMLSIVACISGINEKLFFVLWVPHLLLLFHFWGEYSSIGWLVDTCSYIFIQKSDNNRPFFGHSVSNRDLIIFRTQHESANISAEWQELLTSLRSWRFAACRWQLFWGCSFLFHYSLQHTRNDSCLVLLNHFWLMRVVQLQTLCISW